jgi:hypothetical protein
MNVKGIVVSLLVALFSVFACSAGQRAPLRDGLFLSYDFDGSTITVTFSDLGKNRFAAVISPGLGRETVNNSLKASGGRVYEAGALGPIWIPPKQVKPGGRAYGNNVDEVRSWNGWEVGVVRASFGIGGALRGEWYYEKSTGFLVGGVRSTAIAEEGERTRFVLVDTNLDELGRVAGGNRP